MDQPWTEPDIVEAIVDAIWDALENTPDRLDMDYVDRRMGTIDARGVDMHHAARAVLKALDARGIGITRTEPKQ